MRKIFLYELRRQAVSKIFLGLLAICLFFAWMTLKTSVIQGIGNTAPFSPWSFGSYFASMTPVLVITLIFGLWNIFSSAAQRVEILTSATPVSRQKLLLVKCSAALVTWLLMLLCTVLLGLVFMKRLFGGAVSSVALGIPCLVTVLPAAIFFWGMGMLAGTRRSTWQRVGLISLAVVLSLVPFGGYSLMFGMEFFAAYPYTLGELDPAFTMPVLLIATKLLYVATGAVCTALSLRAAKRSPA